MDGVVECGKCGVIMAKAMNSRPRFSATSSSPPVAEPAAPVSVDQAEAGPKPASLAAITVALAAVALAAWWLNFPSSSSVSSDAYINLRHQFALSAPREWLQLTPENFKQVIEEYKDRFPKELMQFIDKPQFEVSFIKIPSRSEEFSPSINVVVMPLKQNLPPLTESRKDEAVKMIGAEMERYVRDYSMESSSIVTVDELASLQITGNVPLKIVLQPAVPIKSEKRAFGMHHVVGHTEEVSTTYELRMLQTMVPGKKRGYVITYTGEAGSFSEVAPVFDGVTKSFRVLERPPRFGSVVTGALNGGLIGAGIYLFYVFIGRLMLALSKQS
jgi:hypothetical protein